MVNLVGDVPDLSALERESGVYVHIYGKTPAPGRKLGHVTLVATDTDKLETRLAEALALIGESPGAAP